MAFNPLLTFQRNKKFWMVVVIFICMVAFLIPWQIWEGLGRGFGFGKAVVEVGGHSMSLQDLNQLRIQRNLANEFMQRSSEFAFNKLSKILYDEEKKGKDKDADKRQEQIFQLRTMRSTIAHRKSTPRYFDMGVKINDLEEFKIWQVQADRMGIHLSTENVDLLLRLEFFNILSPEEYTHAQNLAKRNFSHVNDAFVLKSITEEFRVRIAQYAVMQAQPFSYFSRGRKDVEGIQWKFSDPDMPDQIRAPLTPAQIWDYYKAERSEFEVKLIPLHVGDKDFLGKITMEPNAIQQKTFFDARKNLPIDPSSDSWGFVIPSRIRIEYAMADPNAPGYHDVAKMISQLQAISPIAYDPVSSPLMTASRYIASHQRHMMNLQDQYENHVSLRVFEPETTMMSWGGYQSAIAARLAKRHPEAGASASVGAFMDPFGSLGGYMAWGALKHPDQMEAGTFAELKRRAPLYATLFATSASMQPLDLAAPILGMDNYQSVHPLLPSQPTIPMLPVEAVQDEILEMLTRGTAEEWARTNVKTLRKALEGAAGDPEKYRRELNKTLKDLNLVYGPPDDKKNIYYNRFSVNEAKELEPLRERYLKYIDMINLFEGRDVTPERILKSTDFAKMFFDPTESFSATAPYRAMPWPPAVKPHASRAWKQKADPRLISYANINPDDNKRFFEHLMGTDPSTGRQPPMFELFDTAAKPILFWRTGEIAPFQVTDFTKIAKDLERFTQDLAKTEADLKQNAKDPVKVGELQRTRDELTSRLSDLKEVQTRIIEGWKFDEARNKEVLPFAKNLGKELITTNNAEALVVREIEARKHPVITIDRISLLKPEAVSQTVIDYFPFQLPKKDLDHPRDDMAQQLVALNNLKEPIKTGNEQLDQVNKELFDFAVSKHNLVNDKDGKMAAGKFVQILTNKPRSIYYVAFVSKLPAADPFQMKSAFTFAPFGVRQQDMFLTRAQERAAKDMRAAYVAELKSVLGYNIVDEAARKNFDDRGSGGD